MSRDPEPLTPEWYNAAIDRALDRIKEATKPELERHTKGDYIAPFTPVTLATLEKMPPPAAIQMVAGMMRVDSARAEGVRLFGQYLSWMETQGLIGQGAAKQLAGQFAGKEVAQLVPAGPPAPSSRMTVPELLARREASQGLAAGQLPIVGP